MKVKLINPPSPFLTNEKVFSNTGLVRVATHMKKDNIDVEILDYAGSKNYLEKISNVKADVIGFSSTTPQFPYVYKMMKEINKHNPDTFISIGGAHPSSLENITLDDINVKRIVEFDNVFLGEGEDYKDMFIPGIQRGKLIKNLDEVEIPDRSLIDTPSYKYKIDGEDTTNIQTQRGCPHKCVFCCGRDIEMYNRVRFHSPKRVIKELDELNEQHGYMSFMFYDDEVNINISRLEKLCDKLSERPYQYRGFIRSDNIVKHPESVRWMENAGFVKLCAGVESGSDKILKTINKKTTYKMNLEARRIIGYAGIHYESFLLLGLPGETKKDIKQTINWIKEAKPDDFDINVVMPYPGSIIYNEAKASTRFKGYNYEYNGLYLNKPDFSKVESFYKGVDGKSASDIRTNKLSNCDLHKMREDIEGLK